MKKIENLASLEGRKILQNLFKEMRFIKQRSALSTLFLCWRICVSEKDYPAFAKLDIHVMHSLGIVRGSMLWMEEIVNRFYFSTINSFVYFGAAVLLVLIGVRRFSTTMSDTAVIWGIIFEATMLLCMFIVMVFSPSDAEDLQIDEEDQEDISKELITEIGEIGRDFAVAVVQLEKLNDNLASLISRQDEILSTVTTIAESNAAAVSPNPKLIENMKDTAYALEDFKNIVENLSQSTSKLQREQVDISVRKELERILSERVQK